MRREHTYDTIIPAFTYGVEPSVPPESLHTLGTRLLLVAKAEVPSEAIARLLEVIFASRFSQLVYPPLSPELLNLPPDLSRMWARLRTQRNQPLIAGDFIDMAEKWFSMVGVTAGGEVCLWQWLRRRARLRQDRGFEAYIVKVAEVDAAPPGGAFRRAGPFRPCKPAAQLVGLKQEALEKFAAGELEGEALMSGFLSHVSDTSTYLTRLILHEHDNLEDTARMQGRTAEAFWDEAINRTGPAPDGSVAAGPA